MDLILHHYPASPFSHKVRAVLGYKSLAWSGVTIPMMMPKPNLLPLTGGYRRTPVLQIGADIFCDTKLILEEIDRRHPQPPLHPGGEAGRALDHALAWWADHPVFATGAGAIFGAVARFMPEPFMEDRRQLMGASLNIAQMEAAGPAMSGQFRSHLAAAEAMLRANPFLRGAMPCAADFALYHVVWFVRNSHPGSKALFAGMEGIEAWFARIEAFGEGREIPMAEDAALEVARDATPAGDLAVDAGDPAGMSPGDAVVVMADDYGRDPVAGRLAGLTGSRISIRREDPQASETVVHFPRTGYLLFRAS